MGFIDLWYISIEGFGIGFLHCEKIPISDIVEPIEYTLLIGFLSLVCIIFTKLYSEFKGKYNLSLIIGLFLFILPFAMDNIIHHFRNQLPC